MTRRYRRSRLQISLKGTHPAHWRFAGRAVAGTEFTYAATDHNYTNRNSWEFLVHVPRRTDEELEVRPSSVPNLKVWAGLERRSIALSRASRNRFRGRRYAKVTLADPTERKTKRIVRFTERGRLPRWFDDFHARMQPKGAVTVTNAHDGHQLIMLFREDEHQEMIALFFASKVWILKEQVDLDNVSIGRGRRLR